MLVYWFAEDLMSSVDPVSSEVLINLNNVLSKAEKKKRKKIPRYQ